MCKKSIFTGIFCVTMLISQMVYPMFSEISCDISQPSVGDTAQSANPRSAICDAVKACNRERLQYLVLNGADLEETDEYEGKGETPLIIAARLGYIEFVTYLVEKGADVHARQNGNTALFNALQEGHLRIVKYLVNKGATYRFGNIFKTENGQVHKRCVTAALNVTISSDKYAQEKDRVAMIRYLLKEAAQGNIKISVRDFEGFIKDAKSVEAKLALLNDYFKRRQAQASPRQNNQNDDRDSLLVRVFPALKIAMNQAIAKKVENIKSKIEERDLLSEETGAKKQSAKPYLGFLGKSSWYYTLYGDLNKELKPIKDKQEQVNQALKKVIAQKEALQHKLKLLKVQAGYESDSEESDSDSDEE